MNKKLKMAKMKMTCSLCPTQWDGWTEDDTYAYFRYRWGHLSVELNGVLGPAIVDKQIGDSLDGSFTKEQLIQQTGDELDFSECSWE